MSRSIGYSFRGAAHRVTKDLLCRAATGSAAVRAAEGRLPRTSTGWRSGQSGFANARGVEIEVFHHFTRSTSESSHVLSNSGGFGP